MAKKYAEGWISTPIDHYLPRVTEKAIAVTYEGPNGGRIVYFPKSQILFSEKNECGNCRMAIPMWLFRSKGIDYRKVREVDLQIVCYNE